MVVRHDHAFCVDADDDADWIVITVLRIDGYSILDLNPIMAVVAIAVVLFTPLVGRCSDLCPR